MASQPAPTLANILNHPAVWRIGQMPASLRAAVKTGFASLDQALPAQGWEHGALTEILSNEQGIGELSLLVPALRQMAQQGQGIVLVAPPYIPFPHAWEAHGIALKQLLIVRAEGQDALWAAEQAARSGACGMVVVWTSTCRKEMKYQALRRLQMAAEAGGTTLVLYRAGNAANEASAAPTRINISAQQGELQLHIIKRRAALMAEALRVNVFPLHWARRTQARAKMALNPPAPNTLQAAGGDLLPLPLRSLSRTLSASR